MYQQDWPSSSESAVKQIEFPWKPLEIKRKKKKKAHTVNSEFEKKKSKKMHEKGKSLLLTFH